MTMASRIAVMSEGRFLQVGPPSEIYETPATRFVANFLGKTNLVNGTTVRPEKISFGASGLAGKVRTRIFQGNHWLYQVDTSDGLVTVIRQNTGEVMPAEAASKSASTTSTWRCPPAASTASSARMARARPPPSACCWACCGRTPARCTCWANR